LDKISSILKGNARVTSVDLNEAPPARPGSPSVGRKPGRNTVSDRITLSEKAKELAAQDTMMVRNPKEASRAKKVEELNKRFFETRLNPVEKETSQSEVVANKIFEADDLAPLSQEELSAYEQKAPATPRFSVEA